MIARLERFTAVVAALGIVAVGIVLLLWVVPVPGEVIQSIRSWLTDIGPSLMPRLLP